MLSSKKAIKPFLTWWHCLLTSNDNMYLKELDEWQPVRILPGSTRLPVFARLVFIFLQGQYSFFCKASFYFSARPVFIFLQNQYFLHALLTIKVFCHKAGIIPYQKDFSDRRIKIVHTLAPHIENGAVLRVLSCRIRYYTWFSSFRSTPIPLTRKSE